MNKNYCLMIIISLLSFYGCSSLNPSFGITSFGQKDTKVSQTIDGEVVIDTMVVIPIGMSLSSDDDMGLKIGRIKKGNIVKYYFSAEVYTSNWIYAKNIAIKIDDSIYYLHDDNPIRKVISGQYVVEILTINITPEILNKLKSSKTFSAELYKRVVTLEDKNLVVLKNFIQ